MCHCPFRSRRAGPQIVSSSAANRKVPLLSVGRGELKPLRRTLSLVFEERLFTLLSHTELEVSVFRTPVGTDAACGV